MPERASVNPGKLSYASANMPGIVAGETLRCGLTRRSLRTRRGAGGRRYHDTKISPSETERRNPTSITSFRARRPSLVCEMSAISRHFERAPILYALETDWPVEAGGFEPPHLNFRISI